MRITLSYITPLLVAGAAAAAIAAAPAAIAASANPAPVQPACTNAVCPDRHTSLAPNAQPPGNVEVNDSPGPVQYWPQYPYWWGENFGGDVIGGFGHGGFGGGSGHGR